MGYVGGILPRVGFCKVVIDFLGVERHYETSIGLGMHKTIGIHNVFIGLGSFDKLLIYIVLTNSFGEQVIAANVIIMRVDGFAMMPNFSFGTALTTYAGQNIGAGKIDRVEQGACQGTLMAVGVSTILTALIVLFGRHLMGLFTNTDSLVELSKNMMNIIAVGYIGIAVTQCLSGIMRGAGDTMTPMWISLGTTVALRVPLAYGIAYFTKSYAALNCFGVIDNDLPEAILLSVDEEESE